MFSPSFFFFAVSPKKGATWGGCGGRGGGGREQRDECACRVTNQDGGEGGSGATTGRHVIVTSLPALPRFLGSQWARNILHVRRAPAATSGEKRLHRGAVALTCAVFRRLDSAKGLKGTHCAILLEYQRLTVLGHKE